ncbi:carbohydrate ABC transporter permease [Staphylospora marina]|uniref:carbohydrate ABC transporter permease n=1 Tax=Staphylospora marina TaxID=2490858 RepID=UPI000F5BC6C0|nr:sugar ABC transporter permease [Staphylospora marina]
MKKPLLDEKRMGALLLFPSLITILVIAIWPVLRSFWISLHDVRLNNPTKTQVHADYGINLEKFSEVYPVLKRNLDAAAGEAEPDVKQELTALKERAEKVNGRLMNDPDIARKLEQVDELLLEGDPVPEELRTATLTKETADEIMADLKEIRDVLSRLAEEKKLKDDTLSGLGRGLSESVIEPNFVGLGYYVKLIKDKRMWDALENTFVFTVISVSLELILGLAIAIFINRKFFGRGMVRAAVLVPWAIPTVISALMWKFMFDGQNGIVAKWFETIGLVSDMGELLTTKFGSMFAIIFADVWKTTPFMALLLLAGLQTIPRSLYEAADVDGASKLRQFIHITLPMLKSTILVALLFRTLDAFRIFDLVYVLTGGGPANATETISIYAYKTMFAQMNFGEGSALSVVVFLCVALISGVFVKLLGADLISDGRGK